MANESGREKVVLKFTRKIQGKLLDPETKQEKIIKYLENLQKLPISFNVLKLSGIGKAVSKLRKQDSLIGEIARNLVIKWKEIVTSQRPQKVETEVRLEDTKPKDGNEVHSVSEVKVENLMPSSREHWKDVSLDLLGERAAKLTKEKSKRSKHHGKPYSNDKEQNGMNPINEKLKTSNLIEVKHKQAMPSLPDIKLPEVQKYYRPNHFAHLYDEKEDTHHRRKANVADEDLEFSIVSRKSRTSVFSGKRSYYGVVQSLYNQCMRVLAENIDALEDTGGVPFDILEPILSKISPAQLIRLEEFNPYFTEDSGGLWKRHCEKEFRGCVPDEMESWRELYLRKCVERNEKLKNIQTKISASQSRREPTRQAKLAYIAEPSCPMRRKQAKHCMGGQASKSEVRARNLKAELDRKHKSEAEDTILSVKVPRRDHSSVVGRIDHPRPDLIAKKSARKPMMKAAMKMMKNQRKACSRRR